MGGSFLSLLRLLDQGKTDENGRICHDAGGPLPSAEAVKQPAAAMPC
jgi:hypothetical protein